MNYNVAYERTKTSSPEKYMYILYILLKFRKLMYIRSSTMLSTYMSDTRLGDLHVKICLIFQTDP